MKEENIDNRIERIIEQVASKMESMDHWKREFEEKESRRKITRKRWMVYGLPVAASVIVICCIGLVLFFPMTGSRNLGTNPYEDEISESLGSGYRGGSAEFEEISDMIKAEKYDEAMEAINQAIADTVIDPDVTPERYEYLTSLNADRKYELTWLKIQILVKKGEIEEANCLLSTFIRKDGRHWNEADSLIQIINR